MDQEISNQSVRLVARRRPLTSDRLEALFPPGTTLAAMLRDCGLDPDVVPARVCIDDRVIDDAQWEHVMPHGGQIVSVRVIPRGGGGQSKDILRIVAMVGVLALALVAPYLAPVGWGLVGSLSGALLTGAVSLGGSLRVRELLRSPTVPCLEVR